MYVNNKNGRDDGRRRQWRMSTMAMAMTMALTSTTIAKVDDKNGQL
jgi:hypothetical protein